MCLDNVKCHLTHCAPSRFLPVVTFSVTCDRRMPGEGSQMSPQKTRHRNTAVSLLLGPGDEVVLSIVLGRDDMSRAAHH